MSDIGALKPLGTTTYDVVVIGAGIAGLSIGAELASHCKVLVIEAESQPGYHATGRSGALLLESYGHDQVRALTRASIPHFKGTDSDANFMTQRGCLFVATVAQLESLTALCGQPDLRRTLRQVTTDEARALVPVLRQDYVASAALETGSYDLDVHAILSFNLRRLNAAGGRLLTQLPVEGLERVNAGWIVRVGGLKLAASFVVNAAGAWADKIAEIAGLQALGLTPMRRTAATIDAPDGQDVRHWPAVVDIDENFYFKPDAGRLMISPADETPTEPCDAHADDLDVAIGIDRVQIAADLPVLRMPRSWAGLRTFAPDRLPVVGADPHDPGFFWLAGQGGFGIQTSPALAILGAAMLLERQIPAALIDLGVDAAALAPGRLRERAS